MQTVQCTVHDWWRTWGSIQLPSCHFYLSTAQLSKQCRWLTATVVSCGVVEVLPFCAVKSSANRLYIRTFKST